LFRNGDLFVDDFRRAWVVSYRPPIRLASTITPALVHVQYTLPLRATATSVGSRSINKLITVAVNIDQT
jgi:hypothetical protein